ncbi:MAG: hypothetical protein GY807_00645 [Gammaproteobacteria bacterium]|nr:hypothetical protein [Gammaproteobacteria bacterium]
MVANMDVSKGGTSGNISGDAGSGISSAATTSLERFARSFEVSARRWELVVYPTLFAFILLAGYGFFLIYSLTQDMHVLARSMDPRMSPHMEQMSVSVRLMSDEMEKMGVNIDHMATEVGMMSSKMNTLEPILVNMSEMNKAIHTMATSMGTMTANTSSMTRNTGYMTHEMGKMGRPMNIMNSFFPW